MALYSLLLAGCAAKRDSYNVPVLDLPKQYTKAPEIAAAADSRSITPLSSAPSLTPRSSSPPASSSPLDAALTEWWRLLGSEELNGLMDRALANNPDLRITALRIAQSKARLDQAGADKAPVITMPIQVRNDYPEFGPGRGNANGINKSRMTHQISLKGDWRPDIWGETYSLYESAELQLLRATYQRDDMQRNVVANVVASYMEYLSLNDRLRVARETEKSLGEMLASVGERLDAGDATITEMEQQKAAVYSAKATIPVLGQQREIVLNRLASLLGSAPVELKLSNKGLNSAKFPQVLPGVPSALLLRRPDVRAVETRLLAADADIDVARARVLPPLDLTAQIGYGSTYLSKLFMPQALFWSTIANLSVTVFDSGKRSKEVEFAQAMHEELLETYVRVIYDAVREVDDSLSAISFMGKRLEAQGVAADSSLRAWNFSQEAFMAGAVDYLTVLDTQRTYQRNLDDWYNVRMERYRGLINLFSALGGGVHGGEVMPGGGARSAGYGTVPAEVDALPIAGNDVSGKQLQSNAAKVDTASHSKAKGKGVDWNGELLHNGANHWLVELSGVYDRGAVLPAWRDLHARFPLQVDGRILLPQRQGQVNTAGKERASWYRLFIATFSDKEMADEFCATLSAGQQRCGAVSSQSLAGKGDFVAPSILEQSESAVAGAGVAIKTEDAVSSDRNDKDGQATEAEAMRAQVGQDAKAATETTSMNAGLEAEKQVMPEIEQPEIKRPEIKQPAEAEAAQLPASSPEVLIARWLKDWSGKNVEGYLSHYDSGFKPVDGKGREAWEAKRRSRIGGASSIKVRAENVEIERQGELMATARFVETVEVGSYKKTSRKQLLLVRSNTDGEWKIREEKEEAGTEADSQAAAETKAARLKAEQQAQAKAQKQAVAEEKARLAAEDKAAKIRAEKQAQTEAARIKAEKKAKAEADARAAAEIKAERLKARREAEAEAARLKTEQQAQAKVQKQAAAEEKARLAAEAKAAKIRAEEEAQAEAARMKAEKKAKAEADARAAAEIKAERLKARREAEADAARLKAEQQAQAKAQKQAEAEEKTRLAAEAKAAKIRAEEEAQTEAARIKMERQAKVEADAQAAAEAKRLATAELTATPPATEQFNGMDWSDQQFWLVEMTDALDRDAVTAAWRSLRTRFSAQLENRTILPRRQGGTGDAGEEGVSRYQLFIAKFPEKQMAEEFCTMLRAGQQRCGVVSSQSLAGKNGLGAPSATDPSATDKEGSDQNVTGSKP